MKQKLEKDLQLAKEETETAKRKHDATLKQVYSLFTNITLIAGKVD
jgi:hypothetical protein